MNEVLKQRLAGALVLIGAAFLISLILPAPGSLPGAGDDPHVVIDLAATPADPLPAAPPTPVPPVIAAPEKPSVPVEPAPDVEEAAPRVDEPSAAADEPAAAVPNRATASVVPRAEKAIAAPEVAAAKPLTTPKPAAPTTSSKATVAAAPAVAATTAEAAKPAAAAPSVHAPALKLEPSLQHAPVVPRNAAPATSKPLPTPGPVGKSAPAESGKPWFVQAGAFTDVGNAHQVIGKLNAGGLRGIISPADTATGTRYRVRVGPYATRDLAKAAQQRMSQIGLGSGTLTQD